jgi:hypothetical protein
MFLFGLLEWLYVVVIQVTHPDWLAISLTHYDVAPLNWRVDDVGILSFAISIFGFFLWRLETERKAS